MAAFHRAREGVTEAEEPSEATVVESAAQHGHWTHGAARGNQEAAGQLHREARQLVAGPLREHHVIVAVGVCYLALSGIPYLMRRLMKGNTKSSEQQILWHDEICVDEDTGYDTR